MEEIRLQDSPTFFYETERLALLLPQEGLSREVTDFYLRNRDSFQETEPNREECYYTEAFQRSVLCGDAERFRNGMAAKFWICKKGESRIIGRVALNEIIRYDFQSAFLSYQMDRYEQNKGYMTESVGKCVAIAFQEWGLHVWKPTSCPGTLLPGVSRKNAGLSKRDFPKRTCGLMESGKIIFISCG